MGGIVTDQRIREVLRLKDQGLTQKQASMRMKMGRDVVCEIYRGTRVPSSGARTSASPRVGLTRAQVQERHDIPARISKALDEEIAKFQDEMAYEENELKRLCRVANNEREYWDQITDEPHYRQHYGYTEGGAKLWGTVKEVLWMEENITGFRRA